MDSGRLGPMMSPSPCSRREDAGRSGSIRPLTAKCAMGIRTISGEERSLPRGRSASPAIGSTSTGVCGRIDEKPAVARWRCEASIVRAARVCRDEHRPRRRVPMPARALAAARPGWAEHLKLRQGRRDCILSRERAECLHAAAKYDVRVGEAPLLCTEVHGDVREATERLVAEQRAKPTPDVIGGRGVVGADPHEAIGTSLERPVAATTSNVAPDVAPASPQNRGRSSSHPPLPEAASFRSSPVLRWPKSGSAPHMHSSEWAAGTSRPGTVAIPESSKPRLRLATSLATRSNDTPSARRRCPGRCRREARRRQGRPTRGRRSSLSG